VLSDRANAHSTVDGHCVPRGQSTTDGTLAGPDDGGAPLASTASELCTPRTGSGDEPRVAAECSAVAAKAAAAALVRSAPPRVSAQKLLLSQIRDQNPHRDRSARDHLDDVCSDWSFSSQDSMSQLLERRPLGLTARSAALLLFCRSCHSLYWYVSDKNYDLLEGLL